MAIRVTKIGKKPSEREYKGTCYRCNSEMEWLHSDNKSYYHGSQREDPFATVSCPLCGTNVNGYASPDHDQVEPKYG